MGEIRWTRVEKGYWKAVKVISVTIGWTPYRRQIAIRQHHNKGKSTLRPTSVEEGGCRT